MKTITDRIDNAVWAALVAAAAEEREQLSAKPRDEFEGRRLHPAFATSLGWLYRPSSTLRPRRQEAA